MRRYLCHGCKRTVSLLPQFALPYLRFGITVISLFLIARLLAGRTLGAAAAAAAARHALPARPVLDPPFPEASGALMRGPGTPPPAPDFIRRALHMLQATGWIAAHRFLLADLRVHLLGWPAFLAPDGRVATLRPAAPPA